MCLILVAWQSHPDYPLVLAANRDEVRSRATRPAAFWADAPDVLAGRDVWKGGTWAGITRSGRFAALTNYRDPERVREDMASRGQLVADFLFGYTHPAEFLERLKHEAQRFNGFNLLFGNTQSMWIYSNIERAGRELPPGIYGLSNHLLDTPWPKVAKAKSALTEALAALPDRTPLFDLLHDDTQAPDHALPRTGVSLEWERLLSAAFIRGEAYGTRSSTVIVRSRQHTRLEEHTWTAEGTISHQVRIQIPA